MRKKLIVFALAALLYLGFRSAAAHAQVNIAPVALYMDDNQTTGRIVVRNSSNQPQELSIDLLYGYPEVDEQGDVFLKTFEEVPEGAPSAGDWVRVYPRHLVLPPQQQQTIRFSARPPAGLPAGEYWVRPAISTSKVVGVSGAGGGNISANINMIKRTILSLNYRHGNVQTGIDIGGVSAHVAEGRLELLAELERRGNAAYLGEAEIRVFDTSGGLQGHRRHEIAVYHSQERKFELDINGLSPGTYRAEIRLDTKGRAAGNAGILPAPPASGSVEFTVEG